MSIDTSKRAFWLIAILVLFFLLLLLCVLLWLMICHPEIVPKTDTFGAFWVRNFSILIAAFAFAASTLAAAYNALEQRNLRYMENYPYLEVFPILSVDPLPLPIPRADVPPELLSFNTDYLEKVAPAHPAPASAVEFRYLGIALRNVGHGTVTKVFIEGSAEVPGRGPAPIPFTIKRRFNLLPGATSAFTLLPIAALPQYRVRLGSLEYFGHFVTLRDFDGPKLFEDTFPFEVPPERRDILFSDHFESPPAGQGWTMDFWGMWQPNQFCFVPQPTSDDHFLILTGDPAQFLQYNHFNGQGGAFRDFPSIMSYGQTVKVTAYIRATPMATATVALWCHDLVPNPKNRYSDSITPTEDWQELSMLYTSTQSPNLRVHLLYSPGAGQIQVDRVVIEGLYT